MPPQIPATWLPSTVGSTPSHQAAGNHILEQASCRPEFPIETRAVPSPALCNEPPKPSSAYRCAVCGRARTQSAGEGYSRPTGRHHLCVEGGRVESRSVSAGKARAASGSQIRPAPRVSRRPPRKARGGNIPAVFDPCRQWPKVGGSGCIGGRMQPYCDAGHYTGRRFHRRGVQK